MYSDMPLGKRCLRKSLSNITLLNPFLRIKIINLQYINMIIYFTNVALLRKHKS